LKELGTPCLIEQPNYSMLSRWIEDGLTDVLRENGVGCICFAPLQQGLLTGKYVNGIPADSRIAHDPRYLTKNALSEELNKKLTALNEIAVKRGQKLHQMALQWVLRDPVVTSALIGASRPEQVVENVQCIHGPAFTQEELDAIDEITR
jgi:L-glyceraldehyde 3-phosphate reductase